MRSLRGSFLILVIGLLAGGTVSAQGTWSREQYTSENGLHQNRVQAMERDPAGALLIGTEGGLIRFDGQRFQHLGLPDLGGLQPARVLDIIPTLDNGFVIRDPGCNQFLYKDHVLSKLTPDGPSRQPISRFAGVACTIKEQFNAMDPDSVLDGKSEWPYAVRVVPLSDTRWCLRTEDELLVYERGSLIHRMDIPSGRSIHLFEMAGHLFCFDHSGKLYRLEPGDNKVVPVTAVGFPAVQQSEGKLAWRMFWNKGNSETSLLRGRELYFFRSTADGDSLIARPIPVELPTDCKVSTIVWMEDHDLMAIGTDTKGLFIYKAQTMRTLICEGGADGTNNAYNAQVVNGDDDIWAGARTHNAWFTPEGCIDREIPIGSFDALAIVKDRKDHIWFGRGDSLLRTGPNSSEVHPITMEIGPPLSFLETGDTMFIGSEKGIFQIVEDKVIAAVKFRTKDPSNKPTALIRGPHGSVWMANCKGVHEIDMRGSRIVAVAGLSNICARALNEVEGMIFIGTYGSGAFIQRNDRVYKLPMDQQGFLSHVHAFMPDDEGRLWMSTNQGLFNLKLSALDAWLADTTQHIHYAYFGRSAGIHNVEFNGGCDPPFVRTSTGYASFPTMDGLVLFRPGSIPDVFPGEPLIFLGAEVDGKKMTDPARTELPADHREITFQFSLAYWGDPVNVQLEYSLDDGNWIALPIGLRDLRLPNIGFGEHQLIIRKVGGLQNDRDRMKFNLLVHTPYYRTIWFAALMVMGFAGIVWLAVRLNVARLERKNLELERNVLERTKELTMANEVLSRQLETKEMLVSIITHDIVTPLRFISRVAGGAMRALENNEADDLTGTLRDISMSSSKLHTNAQNLLSWIKHQDGRIELRFRNVALYPFTEDLFDMVRERANSQRTELVNEVPLDDVLQTDRDAFNIIMQNLIANAVTHTHNGRVTISSHSTSSHYNITISDTGPGMSNDAMAHIARLKAEGPHGAMRQGEREVLGLGYLIITELLALLQGTFDVISAPDIGTRVKISLPLRPVKAPVERRSGGKRHFLASTKR